jgi:hypothetical protein
MTTEGNSRHWRTAALAAVLCLWSFAAAAQQSGTMLRQTITFAGAASPEIEIVIPGPRSINSATLLLLEFGPDGNAAAAPAQSLPPTATFTVSNGSVAKTFTPAGGGDGSQPFPGKQVDFSRPDAANTPDMFSLSVIHLTGIADGTSERWKLTMAGLPPAGLRANGLITQGVFARLSPVGIAEGAAIRIAPAPVAQGTSPSLAVTSSAGFDLSNVGRVTVDPNDGISNIKITGATPAGLTLSFDLARCARGGNRTLTIQSGGASASASFNVIPLPPPTISLSPTSVRVGTSPSVTVASSECFDLSGVGAGQVSIMPRNGISGMSVTNVAARSFALSFALASTEPEGARTVTVTTPDGSASATFTALRRLCPIGERCCEFDGNTCTKCRTQCPTPTHCPVGQHCCEQDDEGNCTICRTGNCP